MITLPDDYNAIGYDLQTTDGNIWRFVMDGNTAALVCGDLRQPVMVLDGRMTLFAPGYRNINLHGFDIDGIHYELETAIRNEFWTEPVYDPPQPEQPAPRYSKLALCRVMSQIGLWDSIKEAIVQAGKWDEFLLAQDLSENDPDFVNMKNALIAVYPIDAEGILRQCKIEEDKQ